MFQLCDLSNWVLLNAGMVMDRESGGYMLVVAGSHNASGESLTTNSVFF